MNSAMIEAVDDGSPVLYKVYPFPGDTVNCFTIEDGDGSPYVKFEGVIAMNRQQMEYMALALMAAKHLMDSMVASQRG